MKFACIGYLNEDIWENMSTDEQGALMAECDAHGDQLRKRGHLQGSLGLLHSRQTTTLRRQRDKLLITDGPFAETKEQIGGIFVIEADDMQQAVELMSSHPGLRLGGPFEIRPLHTSFEDIQVQWRDQAISTVSNKE